MQEIFLSSPVIHVFVLYVAALLLVIVWPRQSDPPGRAERGARPPTPGGHDPSLPVRRFIWGTRYREVLPVRQLTAACSAEYAARFSAAVERARKW
jgi:hypothetical protein